MISGEGTAAQILDGTRDSCGLFVERRDSQQVQYKFIYYIVAYLAALERVKAMKVDMFCLHMFRLCLK